MEHPGINVRKIKETMSLEEVQGKVRDLTTRLTFAHQTYNQGLINQLQMAMESYTRAQQEMLAEMFGNKNNPGTGKIDIS